MLVLARAFASDDANDLLVLPAEAKLGGPEQPVDDIVAAALAIVDELHPAGGANDEQGRRLRAFERRRELDEHLGAVVERPDGPPWRCTFGSCGVPR